MTALLAAGGGLPLALKIPHVVEQIGSIAGFAAVVGLAILATLYISAARDLRRLREWAGRAPERAAEGVVPGRVPPAPATPAGGAGPRVVQRVPAAQPQAQPQAAASGATNGSPPEGDKDEAPEGDEAEAAKPEGQGDEAETAATTPDGEEQKDGAQDGAEGGSQDGDAAARPPGMPAPASAAAAAAGAKAATTSGPAAPAAPAPAAPGKPAPTGPSPAPGAAPASSAAPSAAAAPPKPPAARPGGSVLPPRAPAPPVRRIPASSPGGRPQPGLVREPEPAKRKRNPVYVVLAVAGVLILGAGAAIGVPKLVEGDKSDSGSKSASSKKKQATTAKTTKPTAAKSITVAVLNGTTVPGLAAQIGDRVEAGGFTQGTVDNAVGPQRANSVVKYSPGHQSDARLVAKKLKISTIEPMDATSQGIAGDATVVVVVGSDQTR